MTVAFFCLVALTRDANLRNNGLDVVRRVPPLQPPALSRLRRTSESSSPLPLSHSTTVTPLPPAPPDQPSITNCTISERNMPPWLNWSVNVVPRSSAFRVAFVTLARDICRDLQINRCQIDRLLVHLPNSAVFVWEDNSADCTADVLRRWSRDEARVHVGSFADTSPHASSGGRESSTRYSRLAELRTEVMQRALAWGPDVVVVYDSDLSLGYAEWAIVDAINAVGNRNYIALCANDVIQ